jgi:hypothetical protein
MDAPAAPQYLSDRALSCRLERAEARSSAGFVEARGRAHPDSGAGWIDVAGAYALFDGVGSPLTQTFGLGLFDPVGGGELDELERFFRDRGADVCHEVSPLADPALLPLLSDRGYRPIELTSVLYQPLPPGGPPAMSGDGPLRVRRVEPGEVGAWARTVARGWQDVHPQLFDTLVELGTLTAANPDAHPFQAEWDGEPVAGGTLILGGGVAVLAGASTVPAWRNRGAQRALLHHRLRYAAERGCDLAMMGALPGSASQRNAERHGFRIAYTRIKWRLTAPPAGG